MRPVSVEHVVSQFFASMATQGVVGNVNAPSDTPEYWVGLYGNYQPFGHAGMDFACPVGTPVRAIASGTVLYAGWGYNLPGSGPVRAWLLYANFPGKVTVIQHDGWISIYAHQSEFRVNAGDTVAQAQVIGLSGNTGGVFPHLHVEALVDLSYKTGGGLIYGRTDPSKYFGGIAAQGTITQEDELSQAQYETLLAEIKASRTVDQQIEDVTRAMIEKVAASVWSYTNPTLGGGDAYQILRDAVANTNKLAADVAKVAAKAATGGATEAQITEAVKKAISESIVTVDVNVGGAK